VILGSDEIAGGTAQLRDLVAGAQAEVAQDDLPAQLAAALASPRDGAGR
jgi:histidyl-tRNA synthetase